MTGTCEDFAWATSSSVSGVAVLDVVDEERGMLLQLIQRRGEVAYRRVDAVADGQSQRLGRHDVESRILQQVRRDVFGRGDP